MADTRKTWLSIAIAAAVVIGIFAVALIGGGAYFLHQHVQTRFIGTDTAAEEFARERARFAGQEPLIEVRPGDAPAIHRSPRPGAQGAQLQTLYALAYDADAHKLVRFNIPFWLLRLAPSRHVEIFGDADFAPDTARLTLDDLERRGPGLVLDTTRHGSQVLVWTQ